MITNALQGWMLLPNGQWLRKYRYKFEVDARATAYRAKECAMLKVDIEQLETGYFLVSIVHGAQPPQVTQKYISHGTK